LQTRLLRVLSDGFFYRVGGHQPIKSDVRVIAATHQNLDERVRQGSFREDLYHRLNVIRLRLPPLRERREDIAMLARHFLTKSARELGVEAKRLSPEALRFIESLPLPGNVRQLENLCHWLTVLAPAQVVKVEDLPLEIRQESAALPTPVAAPTALPPATASTPVAPSMPSSVAPTLEQWRVLLIEEVQRRLALGAGDIMDQLTREFESAVIGTALRHTHGRRIDAAAKLGVGRNTITRKVQDLGLED
jgi:two-component system nitrogen regulation response regulator GlnG